MSALSRRRLLGAAAATAAGAVLGPPASAMDPVRRAGSPRIKLSLCAYSYRDFLQGRSEPKMTLPEFIDRAAAMPLDAVELTEYYFPKPLAPEYIARVKRQCCVLGLDISGSPVGNVFTYPAGLKREREIATVNAWVDRAAEMGAPTVRIFAGGAQPGQTLEQARACAIECIETCCEHAATRGVILALENHGGIVGDPEGLLAIVRAVRSDFFGVNLDTGNFRTEDPYADLAKCAPYAVVAHVKTEVAPKGRGRQEADLKRVVRIFRDVGYRGYLALEYEAAEEPLKAVPRAIEQLRALL